MGLEDLGGGIVRNIIEALLQLQECKGEEARGNQGQGTGT